MNTKIKHVDFRILVLLQELHHGTFINNVLPVVELGFKSPESEIKCAAFQAWQNLIDNFAINPGI